MDDGRGPYEWSHDASMTACMYQSTKGWPPIAGDVVVTVTWQPQLTCTTIMTPITRGIHVVFGASVCEPTQQMQQTSMQECYLACAS